MVNKFVLKSLVSGIITLYLFNSCEKKIPEIGIKQGVWRGEIIAQNNPIPFNFDVKKIDGAYRINLINGDESLEIESIDILGDSVYFDMHIFDISIKAKIVNDSLIGSYTKNYAENYSLPFKADYGKKGRFDKKSNNDLPFTGKWETIFRDVHGKKTEAIGIFKSENRQIKGTFLTKTGDYRYLDGYTDQDTMYLYTFDGNHIYRFRAVKQNDSILKGEFWSGKTGYKNFIAKRNENAELPDPDQLTFLKDGYEQLDFSFPDLNGELVTLKDKRFKNKIVIVQILGTWCPNCMDETKFLSDWYKKNHEKDVEIIGLAYEIKPDFNYARNRVLTMKEKLKVPYDFLIAGTSSTEAASKSLPMLNHVMSFPTTIILDKKGKVRKIHTGFSGPATGKYYEEFVENFNNFIKDLTDEP